jgi:hypothetical protein
MGRWSFERLVGEVEAWLPIVLKLSMLRLVLKLLLCVFWKRSRCFLLVDLSLRDR